ncbi:MAG: DNA adenine methylase [Leptospiraceae bacterium]|nr:DNA adenine methylase [Leptospiraceae bacterium]
MILRRLGNKGKIAGKVIDHFYPHDTYIEPFFGAGGLFFKKPRAKYNILNDLDEDVYNLWIIAQDKIQSKKLINAIRNTPYHTAIYKYLKRKTFPDDKILQALRFLYISNFSYLGNPGSLKIAADNSKRILITNLVRTYRALEYCVFTNYDFMDLFQKINIRDTDKAFIYADPPYIETKGNYNAFKKSDFVDLLDILEATNIRFALSEFDNPFVIQEANRRKLHISFIVNRLNIKNRRNEILIKNYPDGLFQGDKNMELF